MLYLTVMCYTQYMVYKQLNEPNEKPNFTTASHTINYIKVFVMLLSSSGGNVLVKDKDKVLEWL